jgi:homoserine dehydrogenase
MQKPLNLGIAGLGTVGLSLIRQIMDHGEAFALQCGRVPVVRAVSARDKHKDRGVDLSACLWLSPQDMAVHPDIDVFVELMGGADGAAYDSVKAALGSGKAVVTANKALLAKHGMELAALAENNKAGLYFEAAVAGGIPVIRTLREGMIGNPVSRVYGILNGTSNYILTKMEEEGLSFEACLQDAQAKGYAEADPTFDVDGFDTAHKLALLTSLAFGTVVSPDSIYCEGIRAITLDDIQSAADLGYRIKLLGITSQTPCGIEQRVHPTMMPLSSPIAKVDGVLNAVAIDTANVGQYMLAGPGAGGAATASAVLANIGDIARQIQPNPLGRRASDHLPYTESQIRQHAGGYYVRLSVADTPGAFAAIAGRMAEENISLESIIQRKRLRRATDKPDTENRPSHQSVILITHDTSEKAVRAALQKIEEDGHINEKPQMIRIEHC